MTTKRTAHIIKKDKALEAMNMPPVDMKMGELADVEGVPVDGNVLAYDASDKKYKPAVRTSGPGGASNYDALTNKPILRVSVLPKTFQAADVGKRYQLISTGQTYVIKGVVVHATDRSVTFEAYPVGHPYLGAITNIHHVPNVAAVTSIRNNDFYLLQQTQNFTKANKPAQIGGYWEVPSTYPGSEPFRGFHSTEIEAKAAVQAVGDVVAYGGGNDLNLYRVTAFVAGTPQHTGYHAFEEIKQGAPGKDGKDAQMPIFLSQAEFDALNPKVSGQLYYITS